MSLDKNSAPRPTEALSVFWDIGAAARLSGSVMEDAIAESGMTPRDFFVLSVLAAHGDLTPGEIASHSAVPATTVSKLVARFARLGWVEEGPHPDDGRSRLVRLANGGRAAIRAAQPGLGRMLEDLYGRLGPDMADVIWSLRRLEWAMRGIAGLPAMSPEDGAPREPSWIRWSGPPLTEEEEVDVVRYMEWVVARRDRVSPRS